MASSVQRALANKSQNVSQLQKVSAPAQQTISTAGVLKISPQLAPVQKTKSITERALNALRICTGAAIPLAYCANSFITGSLVPSIPTCLLTIAFAGFSTATVKKYTIESVESVFRILKQLGLRAAYKLGGLELVTIMVDRGIDIKTEGSLLMHDAASKGDIPSLKYLLARGVSVNATNNSGQTPLHTAAESERADVAEFLLKNKAQVDAADGDGVTPFLIACSSSKEELIRIIFSFNPSLCSTLVGQKRTIFSLPFSSVAIRVILGLKGKREFDSCETINDFCNVLYPASRNKLPANWEAFVTKLPMPKCFAELEKEREKLCGGIFSFDEFLLSFNDQFEKTQRFASCCLSEKRRILVLNLFAMSLPPDQVIDKLKLANPLFARMHELAGRPKAEYTDEFLDDGTLYDPSKHTIYLNKRVIEPTNGEWSHLKKHPWINDDGSLRFLSMNDIIAKLTSGVIHILLRNEVNRVNADLSKRKRESFTVCLEWYKAVETYWWTKTCSPILVIKKGQALDEVSDDKMRNFELRWKRAHEKRNTNRSSADNHRFEWALNVTPQVIIDRSKAYKSESQILTDQKKT